MKSDYNGFRNLREASMKPYRLHAFICQGKRCAAKGSEGLYEEMKDRIKDLGLKGEIKLTKSGCQSVCKETDTEGEFSPVMVIYPEGTWYRNVASSDIDEIIEKHFKRGEIIERLLHYRLGK
jgi:(2Fe-2S) ferredoxin